MTSLLYVLLGLAVVLIVRLCVVAYCSCDDGYSAEIPEGFDRYTFKKVKKGKIREVRCYDSLGGRVDALTINNYRYES